MLHVYGIHSTCRSIRACSHARTNEQVYECTPTKKQLRTSTHAPRTHAREHERVHTCTHPSLTHTRTHPCTCAQEFNLEKLQLLEQEKAKIRKEFERREAQAEVKKKM